MENRNTEVIKKKKKKKKECISGKRMRKDSGTKEVSSFCLTAAKRTVCRVPH